MTVVLFDTNIWVSMLLNPYGFPASLQAAWFKGHFEVVISIPLLEEIADVLTRPRIQQKYHLTTEDIAEFLDLLQQRAIQVIPTGQLQVCRDPDDDIVLETAILGKAQYLVSRDDDIKNDVDLIRYMENHGVKIISVQHFLEWLKATYNSP